jgi:hypothetical protein
LLESIARIFSDSSESFIVLPLSPNSSIPPSYIPISISPFWPVINIFYWIELIEEIELADLCLRDDWETRDTVETVFFSMGNAVVPSLGLVAVAEIFVAVVLGIAELELESVRGCLVNTGGLVPPSVVSLEEISSRERPLVMAPTPAMVGT